MLSNIRVRTKLLIAFVGAILLVTGIVGWQSYTTGRQGLEQASTDKLTALRTAS